MTTLAKLETTPLNPFVPSDGQESVAVGFGIWPFRANVGAFELQP
jgi:hypothetical protein